MGNRNLNFAGGPWKEFFSGYFYDYEVRLFKNPDEDILSFIIKRDANKNIIGTLLMMHRVYILSNPKIIKEIMSKHQKVTNIIRKREDGDIKIYSSVIVGPVKSLPSWESLNDNISNLYGELENLGKIISKINGVITLKESDELTRYGLFEDPVALACFLTYKTKDYVEEKPKSLNLGINLAGESIQEDMEELRNCCIIGEKEFGTYVEHILTESYILLGIPVIIFTTSDNFSGLNIPTNNQKYFKLYGLNVEPSGFPTIPMNFGEDIYIDLRYIDPHILAWYMNLSIEQIAYLKLEKVINRHSQNLSNIYDLERLIVPEGDEKKYHVYRLKRLVNILSTYFPNYFGTNDLNTLTKPWLRGLGKATIIKLPENKKIQYTVIHTILNGLDYYIRSKNLASTETKLVIIFNDGESLFSIDNMALIDFRLIFGKMASLKNMGVNFIFDTTDEFTLVPYIRSMIQSRIIQTKDNMCVVRPVFKRIYKAKLRPPLSTCSITKYFE